MKRLVLIATTLCLVAAPGALAGEGIVWQENIPYAEVLAQAKTQNKLIMIDFYTDWCGPCKMLDKQVWVDPAVKELAETSFINVKIDCEKGEGIEVAKKHHVMNYPNIVFLNPDGTERDRFAGLSACSSDARVHD